MLKNVIRRGVAAVSAASLGILLLFISAPAAAAGGNYCYKTPEGVQVCDVTVEVPETPGGQYTVGPADFTPGPAVCVNTKVDPHVPVPCSNGVGWWSNAAQCYWQLDENQRTAPPGRDPSVGAWYYCKPLVKEDCGWYGCFSTSQWLVTPPPGVNVYTPWQAAGRLSRDFVLSPIQIGAAPEQKVHSDDPPGTAPYRRTWVGIPVWLWVDQPTASTWGPITRTATYGGQTVTGTATVQSLTWSSGDGQTITCGAGTQFDAAAMANVAAIDSPTCGFRYQHTSRGGTFTLSATTNWSVEWSGGGVGGRIQLPSTTSSTQVRVGELQSVNVTQDGDTFAG